MTLGLHSPCLHVSMSLCLHDFRPPVSMSSCLSVSIFPCLHLIISKSMSPHFRNSEEVLPLYRSYITWSRDHLSVAFIGCSDRKVNDYPMRGGSEEWNELKAKRVARRGSVCWGELWHTTSLTSKFKYSLCSIVGCIFITSYLDMTGE